jgi:fatty acid desaturase
MNAVAVWNVTVWLGWLGLAVPLYYLAILSWRAGGLIGMKNWTLLKAREESLAARKVTADATLIAAALAAAARLETISEPPPLADQATDVAKELLIVAERTARESI